MKNRNFENGKVISGKYRKSFLIFVIVVIVRSQQKMNNLLRVDENSIEQCFTARAVQCCQQCCFLSLLHLIAGWLADSSSTTLFNIVDNIEHCSISLTTLNIVCSLRTTLSNPLFYQPWIVCLFFAACQYIHGAQHDILHSGKQWNFLVSYDLIWFFQI